MVFTIYLKKCVCEYSIVIGIAISGHTLHSMGFSILHFLSIAVKYPNCLTLITEFK